MRSVPRFRPLMRALIMLGIGVVSLGACSEPSADHDHDHDVEAVGGHAHEHGESSHDETEVGPNGGRMLPDGDFAVEIVLAENGDETQLRVFAYDHGDPVASDKVSGAIELRRLNGRIEKLALQPRGAFLLADEGVAEPHSFEVFVSVTFEETTHSWDYESFEGRTTISIEAATEAGVVTAVAGPSEILETIDLSGRTALAPGGRAEVKALYPGRIVAVEAHIGDRVRKGAPLVRVEARDSLKTYVLDAPFDGVILERALNVGDVADEQQPVLVLANFEAMQAILHVFPRDAERIRTGQDVVLRNLSGAREARSTIGVFLPVADPATQTVPALVSLPNTDETWRAGMAVEASVTISKALAAVAVKASAIQQIAGADVVFVQVGEVYEAQPVRLGRSDGEWVEIVSGLEAGQTYVSENSFLIRADIEKSGAAHEH